MTREECFALLGEWHGYELVSVRREPAPQGGPA